MKTHNWSYRTQRKNALFSAGLAAMIVSGFAGVCAAAEPAGPFQAGLGTLPLLSPGKTRSISAENPTGEKGKGGMAIPDPNETNPPEAARRADDLGQGWKVRPFIRINAGETATLMDVKGSGIIQHIWLVENINRGLVIRFYWDGEESPSVECPAPDFFAVGHGQVAPVNSLAVTVIPKNALSCFWPMPFRKQARITLTNETNKDVHLVAYQITYQETDVPESAGYFHAQYRKALTGDQNPYVILDGVKGRGRYVGTFLAWTQWEKGWFGEGEIKFYMDGDDRFPTICGTGTEDYFLASYGFPKSYSTAYSGSVLPSNENAAPPQYWSLYRWHLQDPIQFGRDLRVTIQALGWGHKYRKLAKDVISSVAYWYQAEPHAPFPDLATLSDRLNETGRRPAVIEGALECEKLEVTARSQSLKPLRQDLAAYGEGWSGGAHLFLKATRVGDFVELAIPAPDTAPRRLILHATRAPDYGTLKFTVNRDSAGQGFDGYAAQAAPSGPVDLGVHKPENGRFILRAEVSGTNPASTDARKYFGLDALVLEKHKASR